MVPFPNVMLFFCSNYCKLSIFVSLVEQNEQFEAVTFGSEENVSKK